MKKITILILAILAAANIYSQTYTISFVATGAATTVDSVKVENLTHPAIVTWHAGDVLHLVLSNGTNEIGVNEENLQVYPNPMQGQAEISFFAKQAGIAKISIYDIAGKEVLQTENKLLQGIHKYQLSGLKQGVYFINISGDDYFYSAKLISQNTKSCEAKIEYIGNEKPEAIISTLKSTNAIITMPYTTGDDLRFTGYVGSLTAIINDVPTGSKTISFTFTTTSCPPTVSDIDGNIYNTVSIGTQCWLGKNLQVTKYSNGDNIPNISDNTAWANLTGVYCNYNNDVSNIATYGRLYNFYAVVDTRNLCPTGWHVPSDIEWTTLTTYIGGAGGKLKEAGTAHWVSPNIGATNETGFTALPSGLRFSYGIFTGIGGSGIWWSTTVDNTYAYFLNLNSNSSGIVRDITFKAEGLAVRCLRD